MQGAQRRAMGLGVLSAAWVLLMAPVAMGQEVAIEIPFETVIRAEPGSVHLLATASVPPELQGVTCPVAAVAENESSVHPGNNLIVATDGDSIVLEDVERAAGAVTVAEEELTFGSTITVTLVLGEDGVFSAGMTMKFCDIPETTTTTTVETTTTTTETTTTTTTIPTTTTTMETTTTVTVLPTTTVTTTPEATTTVTVAPSSSSTVPETLPFTGGETDTTALVALVALLAGGGLVALTREEADS